MLYQGLPEIRATELLGLAESFGLVSRSYQELKAPVPRHHRLRPRSKRSQLSGTVWSHPAGGPRRSQTGAAQRVGYLGVPHPNKPTLWV